MAFKGENKMKRLVEIGTLSINPKLIEMRPINLVFVSRYRQAYRTGAVFPPLIVEAGTNLVVSGNHRLTAMLAEFGPNHKTSVIFKKFSNELEILKEFAKENATHGNPMDGITRRRIAAALMNLGTPIEEVSKIFNVPIRSLDVWGKRFIAVIGENGTQHLEPVKRGFPASQTTITPKLYEEHKRADRGLKAEELIGQLLRWLKNHWVEPREELVAGLDELQREIARFLKQVKRAA
jgi:hypothetical protein